jgi:hypothetical protein
VPVFTVFMDPSPIVDPAICGEVRVFMKTIIPAEKNIMPELNKKNNHNHSGKIYFLFPPYSARI